MTPKVYFEGIQNVVLNHIASANDTIRVAVAWFTSEPICEALVEAVSRDVTVEIILLSDEINRNSSLNFNILEKIGISIYWYSAANIGLMHHKFCIIDDLTVLTGSYNWTITANSKNRENITVTSDAVYAKEFIKEFLYIREYLKPESSIGINNSANSIQKNKDLDASNNIRRKQELDLKYGFSYRLYSTYIETFTGEIPEYELDEDGHQCCCEGAGEEFEYEVHFVWITGPLLKNYSYKVELDDFLNSINRIEFDDENQAKFDSMRDSGNYSGLQFYMSDAVCRRWDLVQDGPDDEEWEYLKQQGMVNEDDED